MTCILTNIILYCFYVVIQIDWIEWKHCQRILRRNGYKILKLHVLNQINRIIKLYSNSYAKTKLYVLLNFSSFVPSLNWIIKIHILKPQTYFKLFISLFNCLKKNKLFSSHSRFGNTFILNLILVNKVKYVWWLQVPF